MARRRVARRSRRTRGLLIHLRSNVRRDRVKKVLKDANLRAETYVVPLAFDVRGCPLGPVVFGGACQPRQVQALKVILSALKAGSRGGRARRGR